MLKVGLTGGIASGKSTVLEMFSQRGARVMRADEVAHELMSPGHQVYDRVVATFGREILNPDRTINRPRLAQAVFPDRIRELNSIVHPAVLAAEDRWAEKVLAKDPRAILIEEAALMFEAGAHRRMDRMIVVTCPLDMKAQRYAARAGLPLPDAMIEVSRRLAAQMPEADKVKLADYVIDSSGSLDDTEAQVEHVWQQLLKQR